MTLSSGGALAIDTVGTDAINLGIEAAAKTITVMMLLLRQMLIQEQMELDSAGSVVTDSVHLQLTSGTSTTITSGTTKSQVQEVL